MIFIKTKTYVINTKLHRRYFLFLFIAPIYFMQEYIYHSTCMVFVFLPHGICILYKFVQ